MQVTVMNFLEYFVFMKNKASSVYIKRINCGQSFGTENELNEHYSYVGEVH